MHLDPNLLPILIGAIIVLLGGFCLGRLPRKPKPQRDIPANRGLSRTLTRIR